MNENKNKLREQIQRILTKGTFASDVAVMTSGTGLGQLIFLGFSPILMRLFTPGAFGNLALVMSISAIIAIVITLRYEMAIPIASEDKKAINLFILSIGLSTMFTIVLLIFFLFIKTTIMSFLNFSESKIIFFIPLTAFIEATINTFHYWFIREKRFAIPSISRTLFYSGMVGTQFLLFFTMNEKIIALLAGFIIGQLFSLLFLVIIFFKEKNNIALYFNFNMIFEEAKKYKKFPLFSTWNAGINTLARNLPPILLNLFFTKAIVGQFFIAMRLMNIPLNILQSSVSQVFYQRVLELLKQKQSLKQFFNTTVLKLGAIIFVPLLIIFFWGESILSFILGDKWNLAGQLISILVPLYFFRFIISPVSTIFAATGKQHFALIWQIAYALSTFLCFYIGGHMNFSIQDTSLIFSWTSAGFYLIMLLLQRIIVLKTPEEFYQ